MSPSRVRAAARPDPLLPVTVVQQQSAATRRARTVLLVICSMVAGALLMYGWMHLQRSAAAMELAMSRTVRPSFTAVVAHFAATPAKVVPVSATIPTSFAATPVQSAAPADSRAAAVALIEEWAGAWAQRDVARYLGLYSAAFVPPDRLSRQAWEVQRRSRILGRQRIFVGIDDLSVEMLDDNRAMARFAQTYEADQYRESRVNKMLILVREGDAWRIGSEFNPRERPVQKRVVASAATSSEL